MGAADPLRAAAALALVGVLALGALGCTRHTRPPEPDPVAAVVAYRDALADGRPDAAFALIHPDAREGMDLEAFRALYRQHRATLVEQAERLVTRARAAPPDERAWVRYGGDEVELQRTDAGWRLMRPVGGADP